MRNLKTFEEYKYLNIGNKKYSTEAYPIKDANEPFFNSAKKKYRAQKEKELKDYDIKRRLDSEQAKTRQMQEWDDMEMDMENGMRDMEKDDPEEKQKFNRTKRENYRRQLLRKRISMMKL
jgi:hypothetical protein